MATKARLVIVIPLMVAALAFMTSAAAMTNSTPTGTSVAAATAGTEATIDDEVLSVTSGPAGPMTEATTSTVIFAERAATTSNQVAAT